MQAGGISITTTLLAVLEGDAVQDAHSLANPALVEKTVMTRIASELGINVMLAIITVPYAKSMKLVIAVNVNRSQLAVVE